MDKRGRLVAIVAHCILNQNTVVKPLASHRGSVVNLVEVLVRNGYGIVQLLCPETIYLGLNRWQMSREQYDTYTYREHAKNILKPYISLLRELARDGSKYVLIGVKGSPSCAVETTTSNPYWQGEPRIDNYPESTKIKTTGVFMEVFLELIKENNLPEPILSIDIDHEELANRPIPSQLVDQLTDIAKRVFEEHNR